MEENSVNNRVKGLKPFKKGETGNPNGRPKGQRNYATIYRDALIKIAKAQNKTPEEIETMMHEAGIKQSIKGNHKFHAYIMDKIHGKTPAIIKAHVTVEPNERIKKLAKKLNAK
jgi:hypothetical protein